MDLSISLLFFRPETRVKFIFFPPFSYYFALRAILLFHIRPSCSLSLSLLSFCYFVFSFSFSLFYTLVIEVDGDGVMRRFRYNNDDRAPLINLPSEDIPLFYRHLHTLTRIIRDPKLSAFVRLRAGDGVIVDNHRVMHGRQSFRGPRNLLGWYMDRDELESCARRVDVL